MGRPCGSGGARCCWSSRRSSKRSRRGIVTFEDEFAMHTVLPDGRRVGDEVAPAITAAYERGELHGLLAIERG
jgi:hypothetical protein